jgi:hypothetical protein
MGGAIWVGRSTTGLEKWTVGTVGTVRVEKVLLTG